MSHQEAGPMASVFLEKVCKSFGNVEAVKDFNLEIQDKEFTILVGPSGCGKSTTLRMVAGLEEVTKGRIYIGDRLVNNLPPKDRDIAMVFQDYGLYSHMTVYKNMAFGLKLRKFQKPEINQRVKEAAEILGLQDLLDRKPRQLSGGQRQRVAVGRAIVRKPAVFLFDEPLSNLDAKLRVQMRAEISKLHNRLQTTIVYVTHDQVEAMTMGTKIVIMKDGYIQQVGNPIEVYEHPKNLFVAGFIGSPAMNFIPAKIMMKDSSFFIETGSFQIPIPDSKKIHYQHLVGQEIILGIRPEHICDKRGRDFLNTECFLGVGISAQVDLIEPLGAETLLNVTVGEHNLVARVNPQTQAKVHQEIELLFNMEKMYIFEKNPPHLRVKTE
jgi:multiple sugar transport system ATP-binding protein